jgi:hypothetical protein
MNEEGMNFLESKFSDPKLISLWKNLQDVYGDFEKTTHTHPITVDRQGRYVLVR